MNQQIHRDKNNGRAQRRHKTRTQRRRQRGGTGKVSQPHHQRRERLGAVRNLVQLQISHFQSHTAASNLVNQAVHLRKRLIVLCGGTHHTHQGVGKALVSVHITLSDAGLHVNIRVRRVVDGHRLVRNIHFNRVQTIRRRDRNNRRVHVHCVRAIVEHRLRQAQGKVQRVTGVFLLAAERLTTFMLFGANSRHKLTLSNTLSTTRGGGCRLLSTHKRAEAARTPATARTATS